MPFAINDATIHIGHNGNSLREKWKPEPYLSLPHFYSYEIMFTIIATIEQKQATVFCGDKFQLDV